MGASERLFIAAPSFGLRCRQRYAPPAPPPPRPGIPYPPPPPPPAPNSADERGVGEAGEGVTHLSRPPYLPNSRGRPDMGEREDRVLPWRTGCGGTQRGPRETDNSRRARAISFHPASETAPSSLLGWSPALLRLRPRMSPAGSSPAQSGPQGWSLPSPTSPAHRPSRFTPQPSASEPSSSLPAHSPSQIPYTIPQAPADVLTFCPRTPGGRPPLVPPWLHLRSPISPAPAPLLPLPLPTLTPLPRLAPDTHPIPRTI